MYDTERGLAVLPAGEETIDSCSMTGDLAALDAGDAINMGDAAALFSALSFRLLPYVSTASDCVLSVGGLSVEVW